MPDNASMKTHEPPLSPPERCIEFFRQAREALGDEFTILADCHYHYVIRKSTPWTIEDAVKLGKGLKELNIFWLEGLPWVAKRPDLYQAPRRRCRGCVCNRSFPTRCAMFRPSRKACRNTRSGSTSNPPIPT